MVKLTVAATVLVLVIMASIVWLVVLVAWMFYALKSTSIAGCDYDEESGDLTITFLNGQSYTYPDIPPEVFKGLMLSNSPGRYFNSMIKGVYG